MVFKVLEAQSVHKVQLVQKVLHQLVQSAQQEHKVLEVLLVYKVLEVH